MASQVRVKPVEVIELAASFVGPPVNVEISIGCEVAPLIVPDIARTVKFPR